MKHYGIVRTCYENGNSKTGREIYELHKYCGCADCLYRTKMKREPKNGITIKTMDKMKIESMIEYLRNWSCSNGAIFQKTIYETW